MLYIVYQVLQSKKLSNKALTRLVPSIVNDEVVQSIKQKDKPKEKENTIMLSNVIVDNPEDKSKDMAETDKIVEVKNELKATFCDPSHSHLLHSGANLSFYYELVALVRYLHPTVSLFAHNILQGLLLFSAFML